VIAIASDHAGFVLKQDIVEFLKSLSLPFCDLGTTNSESCDYAVFAEKVARAVVSGECEKGILVCGTGIGMSIAANKVKGIRCAVCSEPYSAELSRRHNNANILALGERVIGAGVARQIVEIWLNTDFEGGRHQRRIDMISDIENKSV
jgi:ribose 5-phosphate isomerase B